MFLKLFTLKCINLVNQNSDLFYIFLGSTSDPVSENGVATDLYITEIEKIFGFPPHYTDVGDFNFQTRLGLLGRGWSVQVAEAIFQLLNKYFK